MWGTPLIYFNLEEGSNIFIFCASIMPSHFNFLITKILNLKCQNKSYYIQLRVVNYNNPFTNIKPESLYSHLILIKLLSCWTEGGAIEFLIPLQELKLKCGSKPSCTHESWRTKDVLGAWLFSILLTGNVWGNENWHWKWLFEGSKWEEKPENKIKKLWSNFF